MFLYMCVCVCVCVCVYVCVCACLCLCVCVFPAVISTVGCFIHKRIRIVGGGTPNISDGSWMVSIQKGYVPLHM